MAGTCVSERRSITRPLLLLAALLSGVRAGAQSPMSESQVKAMFVYNFLKFVEWPAESHQTGDPFVVPHNWRGPDRRRDRAVSRIQNDWRPEGVCS